MRTSVAAGPRRARPPQAARVAVAAGAASRAAFARASRPGTSASAASAPEIAAAGAAFATLNRGVGTRAAAPPSAQLPAAAIAAWSLVHGLSRLILDGAPPKSEAETFKRAILAPPAGERSAWTTPP
jgi:hypothetical protein